MIRTRRPKAHLPNRILVGIDESGLADHAACMGVDLGRRLGAKVDLVHVVTPLPGPGAKYYARRRSDRGLSLLARASNAVNARLGPLLMHAGSRPKRRSSSSGTGAPKPRRRGLVRVVRGSPPRILLDAASGKKATWILLGKHRKREFLEFGSTLRTVFARSSVPVWFQAGPVRPIRRILVPVDLSEESLSALATACALAKTFEARVDAVQYFHLGALALAGAAGSGLYGTPIALAKLRRAERVDFERAMARFAWGGIRHTAEFVDGDPVPKILEAARKADLLVLGSHGRTGLASVLIGGTAYAVLKRSRKPVLIVRAPGRRFQVS